MLLCLFHFDEIKLHWEVSIKAKLHCIVSLGRVFSVLWHFSKCLQECESISELDHKWLKNRNKIVFTKCSDVFIKRSATDKFL